MDPDTITIDGVGPMPVERPATVAELCDAVRRCAADGTAIYPVGGGTLLDYGTPPARPGIALSTANLNEVIDFPARDMTITVQAGVTIARLQEIIRAERLWLPIDVLESEKATLGGSIAANVSGARRYGYGTFRDYVIGVTLVNDRGEETKAGGRVVKNVAGYDLMKLYTGSLGTLGVITQVTLKLKPMPEAWASCLYFCDRQQLGETLELLHRTATRPAVINFAWVHPHDNSDGKWVFIVLFEGNSDAAAWQQEQLRSELGALGIPAPDGNRGEGIDPDQDGFVLGLDFVFRANLRPSSAAGFCLRAVESANFALRCIGGGAVVRGGMYADNCTTGDAGRLLRELLDSAADGNVFVERCPAEWKKTLPIWGRPPSDLALQKAVKRALDPQGIFNPGRFVTDAN